MARSSAPQPPASDARARARQMQEDQQRRDRQRRSMIIWGSVLATALVLALVVTAVLRGGGNAVKDAGPMPSAANQQGGLTLTSTTALADGGRDLGEVRHADVAVPEELSKSQPETIPDTAAPAAGEPHHIVVYADFNCVHCAEFEHENNAKLAEWLDAGKATVEYRIVNYLSTPGNRNYSARAANAAYCVAEQKPEAYNAFVTGLFTAYEQHGGKGLKDDALIQRGKDVGADIGSCVKGGTYRPAVEYVTNKAKAAGVAGTPTLFVDGKNWAIDGSEETFADWASGLIDG